MLVHCKGKEVRAHGPVDGWYVGMLCTCFVTRLTRPEATIPTYHLPSMNMAKASVVPSSKVFLLW